MTLTLPCRSPTPASLNCGYAKLSRAIRGHKKPCFTSSVPASQDTDKSRATTVPSSQQRNTTGTDQSKPHRMLAPRLLNNAMPPNMTNMCVT